MSRKGTGPRMGLRPQGWQTRPTPRPAPAALGLLCPPAPCSWRPPGATTQASACARTPALCGALQGGGQHSNPATCASSPRPLPIPAPNTGEEEKNKASRSVTSAVCPAPAWPETQDKGLGQSEGDEGQRGEAAWPGHLWGPNGREARTGWQPSPPYTHTHTHTHVTPQTFMGHQLYSATTNITPLVPHPPHLLYTRPHPLQCLPQPPRPASHPTPQPPGPASHTAHHTREQLTGRKDHAIHVSHRKVTEPTRPHLHATLTPTLPQAPRRPYTHLAKRARVHTHTHTHTSNYIPHTHMPPRQRHTRIDNVPTSRHPKTARGGGTHSSSAHSPACTLPPPHTHWGCTRADPCASAAARFPT